MKVEMFINFEGNCREAVEFYAKVFRTEVGNLMTYGEAPPDPTCPTKPEDSGRIIYAGLKLGDMTVMFMDMPSGMPVTVGNNINPTVSLADKAEITRLFNELKQGGQVYMELAETFYSEWYGMLQDKYGIIWHILYYVPQVK